MNLKNLFASIGVAISSLFSPYIAKANTFGNLNTTNLLYPSLNFDSVLIQKDSNILFASYPNRWDVETMSSVGSNLFSTSGSDLVAINSSSSVNYVTLAKVLKNGGEGRYLVGDFLQPKHGTNPYRNTYGSTPMWSTVDITYTANDFVIKSFDLLNSTFNIYTTASSIPYFALDWIVSFDLYSKTSNSGGEDYVISKYSLNSGVQSINLASVPFADSTLRTSGESIIYQHNFNPFSWVQDALLEEEEYVWISNLVIQIGLSTSTTANSVFSPNAFGWDIPYYTSDVIGEMTGYNSWLIANNLDSSDLIIPDCPECEECEICPICPGDTNVNIDFTSWIATAVGGFLAFEIFPGFSLVGILAIFITISVVIWILKLMAGG